MSMTSTFRASGTWSAGARRGTAALDGSQQVAISVPAEFGGSEPGTNPEQLLLASALSCYMMGLGRLCARSVDYGDSDSVTRSVAAAMLGVHPGTVAQLAHRGTLDRHPDGGITRASVLLRIATRPGL